MSQLGVDRIAKRFDFRSASTWTFVCCIAKTHAGRDRDTFDCGAAFIGMTREDSRLVCCIRILKAIALCRVLEPLRVVSDISRWPDMEVMVQNERVELQTLRLQLRA